MKINAKRLTKEFFDKNNLEFSNVFKDQEKLFIFMKENNLLEKQLQNSDGSISTDRYNNKNTCKYCHSKVEFIDVNKGYKKFCSSSCSAKFNTPGKFYQIPKRLVPLTLKEVIRTYLKSSKEDMFIEIQRLNEK